MISQATSTVGECGEAALLARLERRLGRSLPGVPIGVGDDAAVLEAREVGVVLTTDLLIEDVDFRWRWARWSDVGHKAAAANLSDLAAMGARPRALLLGLGLRADDRVADVLSLITTLDRVGRRYGAPLIGGDLSATSGPLVVSVTAVGELRPERALRRHRGRPGDWVVVSGTLGDAAAGLELLERGGARARGGSLVQRQLRPRPRVELGRALAAARCVRSAADLSDGLGRDALHVAGPGCGVILEPERLPLSRALRTAIVDRADAQALALGGGEDFELVLAVAPSQLERALSVARKTGVTLTVVGRVAPGRGLRLAGSKLVLRGSRVDALGFEHFRPSGKASARRAAAPRRS